MEPVKPDKSKFVLPEGVREIVIAKDQPQYQPLPALVTDDGKVVSQWMPDPSELELLKNGVPVTITIWTFRRPLQPLCVNVGGVDLTK